MKEKNEVPSAFIAYVLCAVSAVCGSGEYFSDVFESIWRISLSYLVFIVLLKCMAIYDKMNKED